MKDHPEPWSDELSDVYHARFSDRIDRWLDKGMGECWFKQERFSEVVSEALHYFDGERYDLGAFVIMPNHLHVLVSMRESFKLSKTVQSWKGYTAREINKKLNRSGSLWQEDYWDRLIRNERHYFKCLEYIRNNPVKANLKEGESVLWEK